MPHRLTYKIFQFFEDVPIEEWKTCCDKDNSVYLDPRFVTAVEKALINQAKFWYVIFYDSSHTPVSIATFSMYTMDLTILAVGRHKGIRGLIQKFFPSFKAIVCGIPVPMGHSSFSLKNFPDKNALIDKCDEVMQHLGKLKNVNFFLYKEFDPNDDKVMSRLLDHGYIHSYEPPMYIMESKYKNLPDYIHHLNSKSRNSIKGVLEKLKNNKAIKKIRLTSKEEILSQFTPAVYELYVNVVKKAQCENELMPYSFFCEMAMNFPKSLGLSLIKLQDHVIAFAFSLKINGIFYGVFCGMDYSKSHGLELYKNLLYQELDYAFTEHVHLIELGQTSDTFKKRLGGNPIPISIYYKGKGPLAILNLLGKWICVPEAQTTQVRVFKKREHTNNDPI